MKSSFPFVFVAQLSGRTSASKTVIVSSADLSSNEIKRTIISFPPTRTKLHIPSFVSVVHFTKSSRVPNCFWKSLTVCFYDRKIQCPTKRQGLSYNILQGEKKNFKIGGISCGSVSYMLKWS